jgi:hypothetical protein
MLACARGTTTFQGHKLWPLGLLWMLAACTSLKSASDDVNTSEARDAATMERDADEYDAEDEALLPDAEAGDGEAEPAEASRMSEDAGSSDATASNAADAARADRCSAATKAQIPVSDDINTSTTWSCEFDYVLQQIVRVNDGATLTIEAGTTVKAVQGRAPPDYVEPGALVVGRGAKLQAVGTPTRPIVFTSNAEAGFKQPGQWGGLILLGNATVNQGTAAVEGIPSGAEYGGSNDADSSGTLRFVRIEYAGFTLSTGKEINGFTLGGVGRGTSIDHVQVRRASDDCFEFFGGAVDAKYLACQGNEDDGFDFDFGYHGRLQFLIHQQDGAYANLDDAMNGIEADNESQALGSPSLPRTEPTIYNMTLCGPGAAAPAGVRGIKDRFGMIWRRNTKGHVHNALVLGFDAGLDIRDLHTEVEIASSAFFRNTWGADPTGNLAYAEEAAVTEGLRANDDNNFDELLSYTPKNLTSDPGVIDCFAKDAPNFAPGLSLTGPALQPPDDGFFLGVRYLGAVRDGSDTWWREPWLVWSAK